MDGNQIQQNCSIETENATISKIEQEIKSIVSGGGDGNRQNRNVFTMKTQTMLSQTKNSILSKSGCDVHEVHDDTRETNYYNGKHI